MTPTAAPSCLCSTPPQRWGRKRRRCQSPSRGGTTRRPVACGGADERRERDAGTHEREPTNDGSDGAVSGVSAEYTLVYFTGAAFVAACAADHAAGVHARSRGVRGDDGRRSSGAIPGRAPQTRTRAAPGDGAEEAPGPHPRFVARGRETRVRGARAPRVPHRSRRSFARASPFSRAVVEDAVARLHASDRGVRVTCVPDLGAATRAHAVASRGAGEAPVRARGLRSASSRTRCAGA